MHISITRHNIKKQKGVSIVTAIFLIIVLAIMGTGMMSIMLTSQQSISHEYTSAKTYMAGRSCLQWGMYQAIYNETSSLGNVTEFNSLGLSGTKCNPTDINLITVDSSANSHKFFNISTTAEYGVASLPEYSKRKLNLQLQTK